MLSSSSSTSGCRCCAATRAHRLNTALHLPHPRLPLASPPGMCRAHGIPHQTVTAAEGLPAALRSAWGSNRHSGACRRLQHVPTTHAPCREQAAACAAAPLRSRVCPLTACILCCHLAAAVIEVVTSRTSNLQRHREIQAGVKEAVGAALRLLEQPPSGPEASSSAGLLPEACAPFELAVQSASYHAYRLPLARPLTTAAAAPGEQQHRRGFLLQLSLEGPAGGGPVHGVGEVAPLPGLHAESLQQAEQQLALLCQLLAGGGDSRSPSSSGSGSNGSSPPASPSPSRPAVTVPLTVALLGGRLADWLQQGLGVAPESLLPSVQCGLEAALLLALAQHRGVSLAHLLAGCPAEAGGAQQQQHVAVNGLLDCQGSPAEAAQEAVALLARHPFSALKVKVGRRSDPLQDAAAVLAIRQAVGPGVALRADANRRWSLEQAVQVGGKRVGAAAGVYCFILHACLAAAPCTRSWPPMVKAPPPLCCNTCWCSLARRRRRRICSTSRSRWHVPPTCLSCTAALACPWLWMSRWMKVGGTQEAAGCWVWTRAVVVVCCAGAAAASWPPICLAHVCRAIVGAWCSAV